MNQHQYHQGAQRGVTLRALTDCPKCKYGTVDRKVWTDRTTEKQTITYRCADCQMVWTEEAWRKLHSPV